MTLQEIIGLLLQGSLMLIVVGIGLQSHWNDVACAVRRPDRLWRAFVAVNIIVPAMATALCIIMPIAGPSKVAIMMMAVSPLAPFAPGKMLKAGADTAFVNAVYVVLIVASIIVIPVTIALINTIAPRPLHVPEGELVWFILKSVLAPLVVGLLVASFWPAFAKRAAPVARVAAFLIIVPLALLFLIKSFGTIVSLIGDGTIVTIAAVVGAGLLGGHWLGGHSPEHRAAMAQAAATRHPGIAAMLAQRNFENPRISLAIVLFLLTSIVVCTIYTRWEAKVAARSSGAA